MGELRGATMTRMRSTTDPSALGPGIVFSAALLMGYHVASRAARDTLFLTNIGGSSLPLMATAASVVSIVFALLIGARMGEGGARSYVPAAFVASAVLMLAEWWLVGVRPAIGSVVFYLHIAGLGPVLISGFWSVLNDSLDARTARTAIGRISAMATVGGLAGLVVAERVTAWLGLAAMLPVFAAANLWCAYATARLGATAQPSAPGASGSAFQQVTAGWQALRNEPHLRNLAIVVLGASISAALLEYMFKIGAAQGAPHSLDLMRVFLGFNGVVNLGTFALQLLFARIARGRAWIVRTIGPLPVAMLIGCVSGAFLQAAWLITGLRGSEAILRGSLFRGGYELLYAGLPKALKNSVRSLIDVGFDRFGDILGYGTVMFVLIYLPVASTATLLMLAAAVSGITLLAVLRLPGGHGASLEASLLAQAKEVGQRAFLQFSTGAATIPAHEPEHPPRLSRSITGNDDEPLLDAPAILEDEVPLEPKRRDAEDVSHWIQGLAQEETRESATRMLVAITERHVGQLTDVLLDSGEDLAVRCRIPPILATCPTPRAAEGLTHGLADPLFELRSACALALTRLQERDSNLCVAREIAFDAVRREARITRQIWKALAVGQSHHASVTVDAFLRERAARTLDHMFTLLSLSLPRAPLLVALEGLKAGDPVLRGTALEYLDSVLPPEVRDALAPVLAARPHGFGRADHRD